MKEIYALEKEINILKSNLENEDVKEAQVRKTIKKLNKRINKLKLKMKKEAESQEGDSEYYHMHQKTDYEKRRNEHDK